VPLQQVLFNLIMNAIEAMSAVTERERQLRLRAVLNERANVRVTVEDTGSGIDPAHIDRIFEPFLYDKSHGMGLGLSICRSIIEAHGGKLSALPRWNELLFNPSERRDRRLTQFTTSLQ
jgi:signal transduction histidine kinase